MMRINGAMQVYASKGKQRMRTGGSRLAQQGMPVRPEL